MADEFETEPYCKIYSSKYLSAADVETREARCRAG